MTNFYEVPAAVGSTALQISLVLTYEDSRRIAGAVHHGAFAAGNILTFNFMFNVLERLKLMSPDRGGFLRTLRSRRESLTSFLFFSLGGVLRHRPQDSSPPEK